MTKNDRLKTENEELRREVNQLTLTADELRQLNELSGAQNYDFVESEDDIVTANVVSLDGTNWMNAFTIDTGSEKGIAEDNVVLCGEGLVGRIAETGTGWSKVVPLIDESSRIRSPHVQNPQFRPANRHGLLQRRGLADLQRLCRRSGSREIGRASCRERV